MNEKLHLSVEGANLVKAFESCMAPVGAGRFRAYFDPVGVLTIGWGHTNHHGRPFHEGEIWPQQACDQVFTEDMDHFEVAVKELVKVELNQQQFDALVSFTYNCGDGNLGKSTLLRKLNAEDYDGAALEFHRWCKGRDPKTHELITLKGLVRRRASEALLFQGIPDKNYDGIADRDFGSPCQRPDAITD